MTKQEKLGHIERIIMSCETYDQIKTCFSFTKDTFVGKDLSYKFEVVQLIQKKTYELRNKDIAFHLSELKRIRNIFK
jgi:hypothetical protein